MASPLFPPPDTDPISPPRAPAPREDLDTGVGGFYVPPGSAPDGMSGVYTYDVGDPEREYRDDPNYPIRDPSARGGNVRVNHSPRDISITTKVTLGHFLGKSTQTLNRIPIDVPERPEELEQITLLRKPDGTTPQILPSKNSETFGGGKNLGASVDQWSYPEGPRGWKGGREDYETPAQIPDTGRIPLSKGFSYPQGSRDASGNRYRNGTDLLSEVEENKAPVKRFMNSFMKNNRFTDESNFNPQSEGDFNPTFDHPTFGRVTAGQLAHVGSVLSLRATGDLKPSDDRANPSEREWRTSVIPTPEQISGGKIKTSNFDVAQIIDSLPFKDVEEKSYLNINETSYGTLNNVHEHYTGLSSLGMTLVAIANSVTLVAFVGLLSFLPDLGVSESRDRRTKRNRLGVSPDKSESPLGFLDESNFIKDQVFGFVPTIKRFDISVWEGIFAFFGAANLEKDPRTVTFKVGQTIWSNSGQISIMGRAVYRSVNSIYKILSAGSSWTSISGYSNIIETLTQNKVIDILNVFATIGESSLLKKDYESDLNALKGESPEILIKGEIPPFSGMSLVEKRNLGWSSKKSAVLLHLNEGIRKNNILLNPVGTPNKIEKSKERRISAAEKEKFESALDSEYVPFYFHDIRTNEIISFHAFLESLTESYSPSVEPVEVMGRVEPIKIYKGTTRKISFSFFIAAVSYSDFDWMWAKINKLLTLIYPQYTEGRMLEAKEGDKTFKFVQPFSQMMSASPMIRLRVGNLIRSNYTNWAMEDMMGANLDDTFLLDKKIAYIDEGEQKDAILSPVLFDFDKDKVKANYLDVVNTYSEIIAGYLKSKEKKINSILIEGFADERGSDTYNLGLSKRRADNVYDKIFQALEDIFPNNSNNDETNMSIFVSKAKTIGSGRTIKFGPKKEEGPEGWTQNRRVNVTIFWDYAEDYKMKKMDDILKANLEIKEDGRKKRDALIFDFMNPNTNSIIKTFKDAGAGGGLAGFIESLNLEWVNTQTTWDVDPGRKAPKMCKVQVEFAPIHDISPGINAQGNNRAPIYRVSEGSILPRNNGVSLFEDAATQSSPSGSGTAASEPAQTPTGPRVPTGGTPPLTLQAASSPFERLDATVEDTRRSLGIPDEQSFNVITTR
jgi:hypothetical protein